MSEMHCSICNAAWGSCDCWEHCACGWYFPKGAKCNNPKHSEPPRNIECPYCHAKIGEACIQRNGIKQAWAHKKRQTLSDYRSKTK
jgi:hypothetical protein